jgi:hypothetical protein
MHSTETRLLVRRKAHGSPYPTRTYHCARYQNQLFYFNEVVRQQVFCIPDGIQLSQHLPGYDNAYEAVREYQLATKYLQWRKQSSNTPHVLELLSRWSSTLQSLSRDRSLWGGGIQTLRTYVEARISEPALSSPTMARARTWLSMASPYLSWVCERQAVLLEEQAQSNHQLRAPELYLRDAAALRTYARTLQNIDS